MCLFVGCLDGWLFGWCDETWLNDIVLAHLTQANYSGVSYGKVREKYACLIIACEQSRALWNEPSKNEWKTAVVAVLPLTESQLLKWSSSQSHREDRNSQSLKDWMDKWMHNTNKQTLTSSDFAHAPNRISIGIFNINFLSFIWWNWKNYCKTVCPRARFSSPFSRSPSFFFI